jgi:ferredoxin--NADP+ reductase
MFVIREAKWLAPQVRWLVVDAPRIATRHRPGHFVILRVVEDGERIPLTVARSDSQEGTITLVVQVVGATTDRLAASKPARPSPISPVRSANRRYQNFGHVVLVGGGVGTAVIYPQALASRRAETGSRGHRRAEQPYVIIERSWAHCDAVSPAR